MAGHVQCRQNRSVVGRASEASRSKQHSVFLLFCLTFALLSNKLLACDNQHTYEDFYAMARQLEKENSEHKDTWPLALAHYLLAYNEDQYHAEPLVRIAQHYYAIGENNVAYLFARNACQMPYASEKTVEHELYTYVRYDIVGICAWYNQAYAEGEAALKSALASYPNDQHLKDNLKFYIDHKCHENPKIVGLIPARNESKIIEQCLHALSYYTDAIVYLDDASDDNSLEIVESVAAQYNVEKIIKKKVWQRDEPGDRNALLKAGREIGGTHFIVIDADEMLTANCSQDGYLREQIIALQPGDRLLLNWIHLWKSPEFFRSDDGWRSRYKDFIFCDNGLCSYTSEFIHTARTPAALAGKSQYLDGNMYGMLHFQFINWANVVKKQAWYKCLERMRTPEKSIDAINERYAFSMDTSHVELSPVNAVWFEGYDFYQPQLFDAQEHWRTEQIKQWVKQYGACYFKGLDFWGLDIENL
jgi:glycosyltransferase involved in cell wall biosynthesis